MMTLMDDRFWRAVDIRGVDECWRWRHRLTRDGYGALLRKRHPYSAHRYAYAQVYGEAGELHVMHTCDNKWCVNPAHLRAGTRSENMQDMLSKGRWRKPDHDSRAKLRAYQVREIRASDRTVLGLSREYRVSPRTIRDVKKRLRYAWVS